MINNKTPQNTNVVTTATSESSIYLKKSELPKNVSAFKNDASYISTTALNNWLKKNSYISKSEIEVLIEKANLTVVDKINKETDDDAVKRLEEAICYIKGEITEIKEHLQNTEKTIENIQKGYITIEIGEGFATKDEVQELDDTLRTWVTDQKYLKEHQSLSEYAKSSELQKLDSDIKTWVTDKKYLTEHQSLAGYAKSDELQKLDSDIKTWVTDKKYITEHQSLSEYVKKTDLPTIDGIVTDDKLTRTLSSYAKSKDVYSKTYVDDNLLTKTSASNIYLTKTSASNTYMPKTEIEKKFLTQVDARNTYLCIEDYMGLKTAATVSNRYKYKTIEDILDDLQYYSLLDGFYIVNQTDIVLIKDNVITPMYDDDNQMCWWEDSDE